MSSPQRVPASAADVSDAVLADIQKRRPEFQSHMDAVVFALHASLLQRGCTCVGVSDSAADAAEAGATDVGPCPAGWNASQDAYTFVYRLPGGGGGGDGGVFVLKAIPMDTLLLVHGVCKGSGQQGGLFNLELALDDHVDTNSPLDEFSAMYKGLRALVALFEAAVTKNLLPIGDGDGDGAGAAAAAASTAHAHTDMQPQPQPQPAMPRGPPPDFDPLRDPSFQPRRPGGFPGLGGGGDFDDDLNPMGPGMFGGGPVGPMHPMGGGGGSMMGPNHPMFGMGRGRGRGPRPRYDPTGPFGPANPDNDHLPPPGPPGSGSGPDYYM